MLTNILQDLRYGARLLRLNPGFAIVAILSLGLGIGANTAIFQLLNAVRLRALPVKNPQELAIVKIGNRDHASGNFNGSYSDLTNPMWEAIRRDQQAFSSIFAWGNDQVNLARSGEVHMANMIWASGDFFETLGLAPQAGRFFTSQDDQRGCGAPGVVISDAFWKREYGGSRDVIGKTITLDTHPFPIIGVTPEGFFGVDVGKMFDVILPICAAPILHTDSTQLDDRRTWWLSIVGRLKPGWTREQATAQLQAISPGVFDSTIPPTYQTYQVQFYRDYKLKAFPAENGFSELRSDYSNPLWMLLAIAGLVLLIACANLANLMLARASARQKEIAVRLALGASRGRLISQLLSESLLVAGAGAALGVLLAKSLSGFLVAMMSTESDQMFLDLSTDYRVLGFTAALAILTCVLFGLAPALRATKTSPAGAMRASGRGLTSDRERFGLRRFLVVTQVALSLVLMVGALLFVKSLRNLISVDAGFRQEGILRADLDYSSLKLPKERRAAFRNDFIDRLRSVPGVAGVAHANILPLSGSGWNQMPIIDGKKQNSSVFLTAVTPGYFDTLGTRILGGRDFNKSDTAGSQKVAIVNEEFARKFMDGANPIGRTFQLEQDKGEESPLFLIVGLVRNTKYYDLREEARPISFVCDAQNPNPNSGANLLIRADMPLSALIAAVRRTAQETSPELSFQFRPFKAQILNGLLRERLMATLSGFFGALAALLAVIGLYGVISYMVARRTNEIGIRMALGADRGGIVRLILREAIALLAIGIAVGAALSLAAARTATSMLFGLKPYDPATLISAALALALVAVAASYVPARRAAGVDPMMALREE